MPNNRVNQTTSVMIVVMVGGGIGWAVNKMNRAAEQQGPEVTERVARDDC